MIYNLNKLRISFEDLKDSDLRDVIYNYFCLSQQTLNLFDQSLVNHLNEDFKYLYPVSDLYEKYLEKAKYEVGLLTTNMNSVSIKEIENILDSYRFFFSFTNTRTHLMTTTLFRVSEFFINITQLLEIFTQIQEKNSINTLSQKLIDSILENDLYSKIGRFIHQIRNTIQEQNPNLELLLIER